MYVQLVLVSRLGGLSLPRKSVGSLTSHAGHDLNGVDWVVKPQINQKWVVDGKDFNQGANVYSTFTDQITVL